MDTDADINTERTKESNLNKKEHYTYRHQVGQYFTLWYELVQTYHLQFSLTLSLHESTERNQVMMKQLI